MRAQRLRPRVGAILPLLLALTEPTDLSAQDAGPAAVTREQFDALFDRVNNAGRWGEHDERGTLNLVTPDRRRAAAGEVRDGVTVSLTRQLVPGPILHVYEPMELEFVQLPDSAARSGDPPVVFTGERVKFVFHGLAFTHVDALSHMSYDGRTYNVGDTPRGSDGAPVRNDVGQMRDGILTRGVLIDVPRLRNVPYLEPGSGVSVEDLDAWEREVGLKVGSGDVLLIRTGRWAREAALGPPGQGEAVPGVHPGVAAWLHERGVAAIGGEGGTDPAPSLVPGLTHPLHALALVAMGMPILDNMDLEELARAAAARTRWTFLVHRGAARHPRCDRLGAQPVGGVLRHATSMKGDLTHSGAVESLRSGKHVTSTWPTRQGNPFDRRIDRWQTY